MTAAIDGPAGGTRPAAPAAASLAFPLDLPGRLARAGSGLGVVYEALEELAAAHGLQDALLVVETDEVGRQAFRLRRCAAGATALPAALDAAPGLHADPDVVDHETSQLLVDLAHLALRLDLARHDASRDALTGLLNRRSYEEALTQAVARSRRYGWPFALVLLDLDHFKSINDRFGHGAGDDALRAFGADLRACLRSGDVAARVGGDEFALVVQGSTGRPDADVLVSRLRASAERSTATLGLRFSAGSACFPDDAADLDALIDIADQRLYADKSAVRA